MADLSIRVVWLDGADTSMGLPTYATSGAAGMDLRANFSDRGALQLAPGEIALVPTGLAVEVPAGYEAQVRPRSGLALKHGITVPNAPGTIDSDYRGPVGVILQNGGTDVFTVSHGDRIAQLVIAPVVQIAWEAVDGLDETARGAGGFGSTGV